MNVYVFIVSYSAFTTFIPPPFFKQNFRVFFKNMLVVCQLLPATDEKKSLEHPFLRATIPFKNLANADKKRATSNSEGP